MKQISTRFALPFGSALLIFALASCGNKPRQDLDEDTIVPDEVVVDTVIDLAYPSDASNEDVVAVVDPEELAKERYRQKYDEVNIADVHLMYADGKKIWYTPWTSDNDYGYINKLYEYDSESDYVSTIDLNKTSMEDDEMYVENMRERNGVITIIMFESRNSDGWVEGTYVWQYNCKTGMWKPLAKACSGAEFVNNDKAVKVNYAECINPDDPTFLKKYRNHYKTIPL